MKILSIETSCDETALALCECNNLEIGNLKFEIICEAVASQIKVHRPYGGVVPALAKREHLKNLPILFKKISNLKFDKIAVTVGPGLEPALWTGINFANELGKKLDIPVIGVNHLEGHIFSNWINPAGIVFPAIVLIVSGGHTILLKMDSIKKWKKLGETRDDAVGEAFDKVAKMLKLPYPGGPEVEALASQAPKPRPLSSAFKPQRAGFRSSKNELHFPRPMINNKNYDFSFSGLKTAVLYYLKDCHSRESGNLKISHQARSDIAASFQQAAIDVLAVKTIRAAKEFDAKSILLCGGVAANKALQNRLKEESKKLKVNFHAPELKYNTDNAVMIAAAACLGNHYPTDKALPNLNL